MRAGYILKHQDFKLGTEIVPIADLRIPIAEGSVNREYASAATEMLFSALSKQRLLFGMGIGGWDEAATKLFQAARWRIFTIPFYFRVLKPVRFCRGISFLRRTWPRRVVLDVAALTGAASVGARLLQSRGSDRRRHSDLRVETADAFEDWSDRVWIDCKDDYPMIALRDGDVLRRLYPHDDSRFHRLKVYAGERLLGWAVVLDTPMNGHKQFGSLRVGSMVDGLSRLDDTDALTLAATEYLERRGVDVIVSNHSHARWGEALRRSGYLKGPSNYLFAGSTALDRRLRKSDTADDETFINRGDGDGPINL